MEKQAAEFYAPWGATVVALTPSLTVVRVTMDFFQHRYYRLNKIMMILIGQWPYQSTRARYAILAVATFLGTNQVIPMSIASIKYRHEPGAVLDFALSILFGAVYLFKCIGFMWNSQKTIMLLNSIRTDWDEWGGDQEVNILHQYAEQGRRMTVGYLAMAIICHFIFIAQPTIPKIIDVIFNNGTETGKFPYPVEYYYLDVQKYYFYIIGYCYTCVLATLMVIVTHSVMLICYTQHVCGIFAALGYVNLIVASYTRTFFITIAIGGILSIVIGLQILERTNDLESTIRFIVLLMGLTVYFIIECAISETLIDHSTNIYVSIYNSQWYTLSLKAQKLLQIVAMRSSIPCQLTAGKMMAMSMRSFWLTAKTALSYLMIAHSMREI